MNSTWILLAILCCSLAQIAVSKFYIESCSSDDKCKAFLGYRVVADTKVSNVVEMFGVDTLDLLGSNNYEISLPEPDNVIIQAQEVLRIPVSCACSNGIRRTDSILYIVREEGETLLTIADEKFFGMVTPLQIFEANFPGAGEQYMNSSEGFGVGQQLLIPFPCACNGGEFKGTPSLFVSYMARKGESAFEIARMFGSSVSNLVDLNSMQEGFSLSAGDVLEIPISACTSSFDSRATDYGLMVPNGTYTITADHCVQCTCGNNYPRLDCVQAALSLSNSSCPSSTCNGASLKIGEFTTQVSSDSCQVTSCVYNGFQHTQILTGLESSNQSSCPAPLSPPTYREYMPAQTPDASPIIEPENITTSDQIIPMNTPLQSSSSFQPTTTHLFTCIIFFFTLVYV